MCDNTPERHEVFDEMLNESYPVYRVGGLTFYAADILYECDPIAYRVAVNDWQSFECEEGNHAFTTEPTCDACGLTQAQED